MKYYHCCGHPVWTGEHNQTKTRVHARYFAFYRDDAQRVSTSTCPSCGAGLRVAYAYGDLRPVGELGPDIGKGLRAWQQARRRAQREGCLVPRDPARVTHTGVPRLLPARGEDAPKE
ncbi:MAG: hypothetical protein EI684_04540 [Candidatus Viridilinea halotolerans]|uniref:Uncharacterized protein n=1 Tax=Candidatus Viridilinea halotolerans TaxID=2491704 RepID=A0A426U6A1_9CHLR|nr:MAG: hypothetical protein EI684_04540 [Candidatus Viridilinea halotolerans]